MVRPFMPSMAGLAIAGSLGFGITGASAQMVYVDPYVQPYPVVVPGSAYIAPAPIVVPRPIVRERTIVVGRPAYGPAPVFGVRVAPYDPYYAGDIGYWNADW